MVARQRADPQRIAVRGDVVERAQPIDVDQAARPQHAEIEQRHQALAARQQLGIAAVARQHRDRRVEPVRADVVEGRRFHRRRDWSVATPAAIGISEPSHAMTPGRTEASAGGRLRRLASRLGTRPSSLLDFEIGCRSQACRQLRTSQVESCRANILHVARAKRCAFALRASVEPARAAVAVRRPARSASALQRGGAGTPRRCRRRPPCAPR